MPPWGTKGDPGAWRVISQVMQLTDWDAASFADGDIPQWNQTAGQFVGVVPSGGSVDLSQYFYLPGRAGGQSGSGGIAAGENLNFRSTTHTTKGKISFGLVANSFYDETTNRFSFRTPAPQAVLDITSGGSAEPGLWVRHTIDNTNVTGPPPPDLAPIYLQGSYLATDVVKVSPATDLAYTGVRSDLTYGSGAVAPLGSAHTFTACLDVIRSGNAQNEHAAYMGWLRYGDQVIQTGANAPTARGWLADFSLHGPINAQPRLLSGVTMFVGNYYNGAPHLTGGPSGAFWAVTKPAKGGGNETHNGATTYPLGVGFGVVGYSGPPSSIPESSNLFNLRTRGWDIAFKAGGYGSGWETDADNAPGASASIIGVGFEGTDVQLAGVKLYNPLAGNSPKGLWFAQDAGSRAWDWLLYFENGAANSPLTGALMLPGVNSNKGMIAWGSDGTPVQFYRSANQQATLVGGLRCFVNAVVMNPLAEFGTSGSVDPCVVQLTTAGGSLRFFQTNATGGTELTGAVQTEAGLKSVASNLLLGAGTTLVQRLDSSGNTWLARELRFGELLANGANYVGFKAPDVLGSDTMWVLPVGDSTGTQALVSNGSRQLSWSAFATPTDLAGYVILAPTTSARNVVQPTLNTVTPLILRGAILQSNPYLETQDSSTARELQALPGGHLWILREMRFGELASQGTNYVGFKAPDALTANTIWTWPAGPGTDGQFLKTDGTNNLSWASAATGGVTDHGALTGLQDDDHNTVYAVLAPATNLRNVIQPTLATLPAMLFRGAAAQSADPVQWQDSAQNILASVSNIGQGFFRPRDGASNSSTIALTLAHESTVTVANGFGAELRLNLRSNNVVDRPAGGMIWEWANATDIARLARLRFLAYDFNAPREGLRIESDGTNALLAIGGNIVAGTRAILYAGAPGNKGLVIQQAATPSANPFEIQSSVPAVLANFDTTGKLFVPNARINTFNGILKGVGGDVTTAVLGTDYIDAATLAGYVILAPAASTRNVIQPTAGTVVPLILRGAAAGQSFDLIQTQNSATAVTSVINAAGQHAIGAATTNGHLLRLVQSGNSGTLVAPAMPLWIDQTISTIDAGGGPDVGGVNLLTNYLATNPAASDLTYTGVDSRITYGQAGTAAKGTVHTFTSVVDVINSFDNTANEFANFFGYARFRGTPGTSGSIWFTDWSVHGPINTQPGLLNGVTMLINNYFNGVPIRGPSAAMWLVTQPGAGAGAELGHSSATTYPVEYGLAIIGASSGGVGFRDAIHVGTAIHPWKTFGASSFERGLHIEGVTSEAIRLVGNNIGVVWGNEGAGLGKMRLDRAALYEMQFGNVVDGGLLRVWGREGAINDPVIEGKTTAVQALALRLIHGAGGTLNSTSLCLAAAASQFAPGSGVGDAVVRFTTGRLLGSNGTITQFLFSQGALQLGNSGTDPSPRAILDLSSTTKGVLYPRWTTAQRLAIIPVASEKSLWGYDSTLDQFFFWNGTAWVQMLSGSTGTQNWTSAAGILYPTTNTDRVHIRTTSDQGAGVSLAVNGVGATNDPLALFYTTGATDSNAIQLKNGTASLKFFMAGATNTFMPGTVVGDAGIIPGNGRLHIGSAAQAAWLKVSSGLVGIGLPQAVDPAATLDVRGKLVLTSAGTTPDTAYPSPLTITRVAANTGQYVSFVRAASSVWSLGMLPNSSVFAIGGGNVTDTSFTGLWQLDLQGRMLVGRSGTPLTGMIGEFYSDPAAPTALGLPLWNNQTEQDSISAAQSGMFGYQAETQTLQYHDLTAWRILARADQIINNHGALQGLENDDHSGYFWMAGRQFVQILIGGTLADADLVLQSTSHGIKGLIILGNSAYNEATQRLGLRTTNPQYTLDVNGDVRFSTSLTGILRADNGVVSVDTTGLAQYWARNAGGYLTTTTVNDRVLLGNAVNVSTLPLLSAFAPSGNNDDIFTVGKGTTRYMVVGNNGGVVMGTAGTPTANQVQVNNARIVMTPDGSGVHLQSASVGSAGNVGSIAGYVTFSTGGVNYALPYYNITAPAVPAAPSGLSATAISTSEIDLGWTDNSSDETSFRVERAPDGSTFAEINSTAANATTFPNTGLSASTQFWYRVRARNANGDSAYSNIANATTQAASGSGISDDFQRSNQSGLGTPTGGQTGLTWSYIDTGGDTTGRNFQINNNEALAFLNGAINYAGAYLSNQTDAGTVKVTCVEATTQVGGVFFRYDPATKTGYVVTNIIASRWGVYPVNFNNNGNSPSFYGTFISGLVKTSDSSIPVPADNDILEIITTSGSSSVSFKVNGAAMNAITCPSNTTGFRHGIYADTPSGSTASGFRWNDYSFVSTGGGGGGFIGDDFNRANHTTDMNANGGASGGQTWVPRSGTWGISSSQAYCPVGGGPTAVFTALSGQSVNATVECTLTVLSTDIGGIFLRRNDSDNTSYVVVNRSSQWRVYQWTGAAYGSLLGTFGGVAPAAGHRVKCVLSGTTGTFYLDTGSGYGSGTAFTLSANATSNEHGLVSDRTAGLGNMRWDNFNST